MNVEVREFKDDDVSEVVNLFNVIFQGAYYGYPMSKEKFLQRLNNSDFYKASLALDYKGKVGGFILANTAKKENKWCSSDKGFISLIMISPDLRGRGFGKALLSDALNFLKEKEVREIEISFNPLTFWPGIDSRWVEALAFFEQMGFRESGVSSSMLASLETFKIPERILNKENELRKEKIRFRRYLKEDREPLLNFIKRNFSYEWHEEVRSKIEKVK
ncbi:MAG: GNAT family N-acetyltransferase, partial [Candidatus Aerophobetes bacterium]|nr:GNAT family N-acetyltransferase [Candidatus Aerophobetes bacterium]